MTTSTSLYDRRRAGSAQPPRRRALAVIGLVLPMLVVFGAAPSAAAEPVTPAATEADRSAAPATPPAEPPATEPATAAPATPLEDVPAPSPMVTPSASPEPGPTPDPPPSDDAVATPAADATKVTARAAGTTAPNDAEPATATESDAVAAPGAAESRQPAPMVRAAAAAPRLGTAGTFAILAGSTITNTGRSVITGDVGLHPGTAVTGFASCTAAADCVDHTGSMHVTDDVARQAKADLLTAYNTLVGLEGTCTPLVVELGGTTLTPGVYCSPTFEITGTLTLSGIGEFIFLTGAGGSSLTTAADSAVRLIDGADSCDVYWQVASSAALGTRTAFAGNILARTSISFGAGATLDGSALALDAAVTLISNTITDKACGASGGETTTPPDGSESPSPTVDATTPPPDDGGATTPPPDDGGATTPPPSDGGGTPPPDDGGTPPDDDGAIPGDGNAPPQDPGALPGVAGPGGSGSGGARGETVFGTGRSRLAATGSSVDLQLLLAGLTLGLGALLVRLGAAPRRRGRHRANA